MASSLILIAIGAPWVGALLVWLIGDRRPRWQHGLAAVAALVGAAAALLLLPAARWQTTVDVALRLPFGPFIGDLTFVADSLAVYLAVIATSIGSLTVIFSAGYMAGEAQLGRYYALVLVFIGAMCGLVFSGNLLFLFLFWEVTALCSYALISFYNDDPRAVAAGLKALIITQLGGVGLLVGILVASAYLPDLQVSTLLASFGDLPAGMLAVVAFGFLLAAMAKSAQFPLHIWLPDAMEAPTPVSALIHAATMVNAGVYLLARFYPAFANVAGWTTAVIIVGLASVLLAGLLATTGHDLKRTLAYSTVSQLGFMVTGVGLGAIFESQFYLLSHAIFKALLFLGAGAIIHHVGTRDMRRMGGLWSQMRAVAVPFLIGAAALMGLPLFNGFWSKEILLETALERSPLVYAALVLGAAMTAFYVARMCWLVFFQKPSQQPVATHHAPLAVQPASEDADSAGGHAVHPRSPAPLLPRDTLMVAPLYVLAAGVCFAWLLAEPFARWMQATLPFHTAYLLPHWPVEELISAHTAASLSTAVVLGATLLSVLLWAWSARTSRPGRGAGLTRAIGGAEALFNDSAAAVANATRGTAALLQRTQTGQLNWNLVGLALVAVAMLLIVLLGVSDMNLPPFVWLILWLLLSAPFVYIIGRIDIITGARRSLARWLALLCMAVAWWAFGRAASDFYSAGAPELVSQATWTLGAITLRFDGLSLLLAALVLTLTTVILIYSGPYIGREEGVKHYALLLMLCGAIVGLGSAGDLFNLWLWFEAMAFASYPLVVFYTHDRLALEAGVKYLVQSSAGSVFILLGIALVLLSAGTLDVLGVRQALAAAPVEPVLWLSAGALFVIGFGVKIALVPLHTWLPDAHSQAPSGISAILSAVVIEAGLIALLRSLSALSGAAVSWGALLIGFGLFNMLAGNLLALRQQQVKRLLAFSSIGHVGYMILGLGIALYVGTAAGAQAGFFHLLSHGLMKGLAFLAVGALMFGLQHGLGRAGAPAGHAPLTVDDLSGAARRYPLVALALSLAVLGLGGLPPLVGFMSKWQILVAGAQTRDVVILIVLIVAALNSVLSLGYYAPLVNRMYRREPGALVAAGRPIPAAIVAPLVVLAAAIVVLGVLPFLAGWLTIPAAADLLSAFAP